MGYLVKLRCVMNRVVFYRITAANSSLARRQNTLSKHIIQDQVGLGSSQGLQFWYMFVMPDFNTDTYETRVLLKICRVFPSTTEQPHPLHTYPGLAAKFLNSHCMTSCQEFGTSNFTNRIISRIPKLQVASRDLLLLGTQRLGDLYHIYSKVHQISLKTKKVKG